MNLTDFLTAFTDVADQIKPLIPAIAAAEVVAQKVQIITQPAIMRFESGDTAVLELFNEAPQLTAMSADIVAAAKTGQQVWAILAAFAAKLEGTTQ
jgi:hypothetical protein